MIQFLEQFLNWVAVETVLSGLLFLTYHLWIKRFSNPLDRFNFLLLTFIAIVVLPWAPVPVLSGPLVKDLISEAAIVLQGQTQSNHGTWIAHFLTWATWALPIALPLAYLLVLSVRTVRIFRSLEQVNQIAKSGVLTQIESAYPVIQHAYNLPPMTSGILEPKILISGQILKSVSPAELRLIVKHEEEHIRRADGVSNLLRILVREALFFSPFIWNLSRKLEEEMELSVDAAILEKNKNSERIYGNLLLKVADFMQPGNDLHPVGTYLSNSSLKRRILSMKKVAKTRAKILSGLALGTFITFGTLGVSLFGTQAYSSSSNHVEFFLMSATAKEEIPHEKPILTDSDFISASLPSDCPKLPRNGDKCSVALQLKPEAQRRFSELSAKNIGKKIAIVVNGKMISAPILKAAITGPSFEITADFANGDVQKFVKSINAGPEK